MKLPDAVIASDFVSHKNQTWCGEARFENSIRLPRLFYSRFDGKRLFVMGERDMDVEEYLDTCGVAPGSDEEDRIRRRWQELDSGLRAQATADVAHERTRRDGVESQQWRKENADAIRALYEASKSLSH